MKFPVYNDCGTETGLHTEVDARVLYEVLKKASVDSGHIEPSITTEQRKLAFALWNETTGSSAPRTPRLTFASSVLGRCCTSWLDLSEAEASTLIDALCAVKAFQEL